MESFRIAVANPINRINFKGTDYPSQDELVSTDDTDIIMDENMTPDDQVEILEKALEQTRENSFQAGYKDKGNSFTIGYGRQRDGIFCAGGVCRYVPASNGFSLAITSSF